MRQGTGMESQSGNGAERVPGLLLPGSSESPICASTAIAYAAFHFVSIFIEFAGVNNRCSERLELHYHITAFDGSIHIMSTKRPGISAGKLFSCLFQYKSGVTRSISQGRCSVPCA